MTRRALFLNATLGLLLAVTCAGAASGFASVKGSKRLDLSSRIDNATLARGMTVSGSVVWTATPSRPPTRIEFRVDGTLKWTAKAAPYRYGGSPNGVLDTTQLVNGAHTLGVKAYATRGRTAITSSSITVANSTTTSPLAVASSVANGATVNGSIVWTASPSGGTVNEVDFVIDGTVKSIDKSAPYQYNGDGGRLETTSLANGTHTLLARAQATDGRTATASSSVTVANAATSPFIKQDGTRLTKGGRPYRFVGINIYMAASGGTPASCGGSLYPDVGVPLSTMPRGIVFRFWAFQNFFVSNGRFDWTNMDRVLAIAAAHGDTAIPVLANQYDYCDGSAKDLAWYQGGFESKVGPGEIASYKQYVSAVVERYANNPTIAMWQLVNEGQAVKPDGSCDEPAALSALRGFSGTMGGLVHRLDPNHLVSLGALAGYSGSGRQWCGAANGDYQTLMSSPGTDVCDFHDYGYPKSPMGNPTAPNLTSAIQMCHAAGKPIMVAETGIYARSDAELAARAANLSAKFSAQFQAGAVGELIWCWAVKPAYVSRDSAQNYGVFPGDPSLGVLSPFISSS